MKDNKIAIIGTVGIPCKYGGFETLVEYLTKELGNRIPITVYCSSKSYKIKQKQYNGASLQYIPLNANGIQSILYDIFSLFSAARKHNTILILGVSGCIILPFFRFLFKKKKLIINIDGLEHRRAKWKKITRKFLKFSEKLAVHYADEIIVDNIAIKQYVKDEYAQKSTLIAYGGDHVSVLPLSDEIRQKYSLPEKYAFKVCRIEPENNISLILEAFSDSSLPLVMVGNWENSNYGRTLKVKYQESSNLKLIDPIFDQSELNQIRSNCAVYIHGHSAGGTNPSLVEAMCLGLPVFAFDVSYNHATTFNQACYFTNAKELKELIKTNNEADLKKIGHILFEIAMKEYTWGKISTEYLKILNKN